MCVHTRSRFWPKQPRVDVLCLAEMDLAADFSDDSDTVGTTQVGCGKLVQRQQESGKRPARLLAAARAREALAAKRARRLQANLGSVQQQLIVALAPRRKHGNQHCRKITYDQMLSMSFDSPSMPSVHKAAAYSVTKSSVRSVLHFVAAVYMQVQMFIVGCLVLRANSEPPDWIMYRLAFDETTERATLNLAPGQQHRSTWHILVSRMWLVICWHGSVYRFSLVMPLVVTTSTKATAIWQQLYHHPLHKPLFTALQFLVSVSKVAITLEETESASSNELVASFMASQRTSQELDLHWWCSLHQLALVEASVVCSLDSDLVSRLYSVSLLLRCNGHWTRMISQLREALRRGLVVKRSETTGGPPSSAQEFRDELTGYALTHYKRFVRFGSSSTTNWLHDGQAADEDETTPAAGQRFLDNIRVFNALFNGCLWDKGVYTHFCAGESCCPGMYDRDVLLERMTATLLCTFCRAMPPPPAGNKWTKLGDCVDAVLLLSLCHGLFGRLYDCLGACVTQDGRRAAAKDDGEHEHLFLEDIDFGAVQGKRYRVGRQLFEPVMQVSMIVLALVMEPLREVSAWLMGRAREAKPLSPHSKTCDLWSPSHSPITAAQQYFATLLWGAKQSSPFSMAICRVPELSTMVPGRSCSCAPSSAGSGQCLLCSTQAIYPPTAQVSLASHSPGRHQGADGRTGCPMGQFHSELCMLYGSRICTQTGSRRARQ